MSYTFQCRIFTALTQDTFENLDDGILLLYDFFIEEARVSV